MSSIPERIELATTTYEQAAMDLDTMNQVLESRGISCEQRAALSVLRNETQQIVWGQIAVLWCIDNNIPESEWDNWVYDGTQMVWRGV